MNTLDKQYTDLLQDILDNGVTKQDRTGTGTVSVFGRQIRHDMKDGFPLLTTKKMPWKTIVTELLWFLRGDTNIKYLVDNNCHIWDGDAYKNYESNWLKENPPFAGPYTDKCLTQEEFINKIKTDQMFAFEWGELGPIYGAQWRSWYPGKDQIANLINDLKTNPDSRRLMVNAWNVGEIDQMVLPPCHYGFQVYTRELSLRERVDIFNLKMSKEEIRTRIATVGVDENYWKKSLEETKHNIPTRAISLMWNQRSVDTFLGLPFNIASYGLLLEIIAEIVNMVPDQLIGNLGDTHLYLNHIEQAKEQIGREMDLDERKEYSKRPEFNQDINGATWSSVMGLEALQDDHKKEIHKVFDNDNVPKRTREPFPLPTLNINTEFWNPGTKDGCGMGPGTYTKDIGALVKGMEVNDFQIENYQSHPTIKAPLSN